MSTFLLSSLGLALVLLLLAGVVMKKMSRDRELQSPFECGFRTFSEFRLSFRIHFFLIALVFVVFDVELIILFPYISGVDHFSDLSSGAIFTRVLLFLTYGLLNEWNQLILEWSK